MPSRIMECKEAGCLGRQRTIGRRSKLRRAFRTLIFLHAGQLLLRLDLSTLYMNGSRPRRRSIILVGAISSEISHSRGNASRSSLIEVSNLKTAPRTWMTHFFRIKITICGEINYYKCNIGQGAVVALNH